MTLTATSSSAGVRIGTPHALALLPAFSTTDLTIPVSVLSSVPRNTSVTLTLRVGAEDTCDRGGVSVTLTIQIGAGSTVTASALAAPATSLRGHDAGVCIAQDTL